MRDSNTSLHKYRLQMYDIGKPICNVDNKWCILIYWKEKDKCNRTESSIDTHRKFTEKKKSKSLNSSIQRNGKKDNKFWLIIIFLKIFYIYQIVTFYMCQIKKKKLSITVFGNS